MQFAIEIFSVFNTLNNFICTTKIVNTTKSIFQITLYNLLTIEESSFTTVRYNQSLDVLLYICTKLFINLFLDTAVPTPIFGLRVVEPGLLGLVNCKYRLSYALAPVDRMPHHEHVMKIYSFILLYLPCVFT